MSNVVPLRRPTCPCGWKPPKKISVYGLYATHVTFECPECGRTLEIRMNNTSIEEPED